MARRIDLAGIVGFGAGMAALVVFLMSLPHPDWIALAASVVAFTVLAWWELRASRRSSTSGCSAGTSRCRGPTCAAAVTCLCIYTVLYGVTQWLQAGRGLSALAAGLVLLPMSAVGGIIARPVSQRNLLRAPLLAAGVSCLAGSAGVLLLTSSTPLAAIVGVTLLFGITIGTRRRARTRPRCTRRSRPRRSAPRPGCSAPSATSGRSRRPRSSRIVFHASVSDHGLHVTAVIMTAVSAVALVLTVADRRLMSLPKAGSGS